MNSLSKEQLLLLKLVKKGIFGDSKIVSFSENDFSGIDWKVLVRESKAQSVMYLAFDVAKEYKSYIPSDVYSVWENASMLTFQNNMSVFNDQAELVEILGDKYPYIILKGQSAGSYYFNPEIRAYGDVDFLIDANKKQEIASLLIDNGYQMTEDKHENHLVFNKGSAHLEMHHQVAGIPSGELGVKVQNFLSQAISSGVKTSGSVGDFNAPSGIYHGLILLLHMQHHQLAEGLGLRHLCDFAVYLETAYDKDYFINELIPFLKEIGLYNYLAVISKTCSLYLGTACPSFCEQVDDNLCKEIILDVFSGGNFGSKDVTRKKSGMMISEHGKAGTKHGAIYNLAHGLHVAVITQTPIVKKVWILYPFIYVYRALRFLFLTIIGKRPKLSKMKEHANKRKSVYDKLKVFEP